MTRFSTSARRRAGLRVLVAVLATGVAALPAVAEGLRLRAEVTAAADSLTLADLVDGGAVALPQAPLFRAPALGEAGTIQSRRIVEAAGALGVTIDPAGLSQVVVTRAARRVSDVEIAAAVKRGLQERHGIEAGGLSIAFEGTPPALVVEPETTGSVVADDLAYDRRSRRFSAQLRLGGRASLRVQGVAAEMAEVAVLNRPIARGDAVQASDIAVERRARETLPADAQGEVRGLVGQIAKHALAAGAVLRAGDLGKPEIVARNETVTVVYEIPGMLLTLRARATEPGAEGDLISLVNLQSKKPIQGVVVAPGKVAVAVTSVGRLAAAGAPARQ